MSSKTLHAGDCVAFLDSSECADDLRATLAGSADTDQAQVLSVAVASTTDCTRLLLATVVYDGKKYKLLGESSEEISLMLHRPTLVKNIEKSVRENAAESIKILDAMNITLSIKLVSEKTVQMTLDTKEKCVWKWTDDFDGDARINATNYTNRLHQFISTLAEEPLQLMNVLATPDQWPKMSTKKNYAEALLRKAEEVGEGTITITRSPFPKIPITNGEILDHIETLCRRIEIVHELHESIAQHTVAAWWRDGEDICIASLDNCTDETEEAQWGNQENVLDFDYRETARLIVATQNVREMISRDLEELRDEPIILVNDAEEVPDSFTNAEETETLPLNSIGLLREEYEAQAFARKVLQMHEEFGGIYIVVGEVVFEDSGEYQNDDTRIALEIYVSRKKWQGAAS